MSTLPPPDPLGNTSTADLDRTAAHDLSEPLTADAIAALKHTAPWALDARLTAIEAALVFVREAYDEEVVAEHQALTDSGRWTHRRLKRDLAERRRVLEAEAKAIEAARS